MNRFTNYLHKINKYDDDSKRIINVFKRMNDLMTDDKKDYDDFNFLIKNKDKIRTWLLKNLATSSVVSYSIALRHAIQSMDISESKKEEMIRFYLDMQQKHNERRTDYQVELCGSLHLKGQSKKSTS